MRSTEPSVRSAALQLMLRRFPDRAVAEAVKVAESGATSERQAAIVTLAKLDAPAAQGRPDHPPIRVGPQGGAGRPRPAGPRVVAADRAGGPGRRKLAPPAPPPRPPRPGPPAPSPAPLGPAPLPPTPGHAQTDVTPPLPNVLLLVDTSGSMEYKTGTATFPTCNPGSPASTNERSRWIDVIETLTGTIPSYSCQKVDRTQTAFAASTYGTTGPLGLTPYDYLYENPYHRPVSSTCAAWRPPARPSRARCSKSISRVRRASSSTSRARPP